MYNNQESGNYYMKPMPNIWPTSYNHVEYPVEFQTNSSTYPSAIPGSKQADNLTNTNSYRYFQPTPYTDYNLNQNLYYQDSSEYENLNPRYPSVASINKIQSIDNQTVYLDSNVHEKETSSDSNNESSSDRNEESTSYKENDEDYSNTKENLSYESKNENILTNNSLVNNIPTFFTTQKIQNSTAKLSYTVYQLELLNAIYTDMKYPNSVQKTMIAKLIGITRDQVKVC